MIPTPAHLDSIPLLVWGSPSRRVYIYAHGKHGDKEEARPFAHIAQERGYQVVSFDLPEHGERSDGRPCSVQNGVQDVREVAAYCADHWDQLSFFGCSLGAYFGFLAVSGG